MSTYLYNIMKPIYCTQCKKWWISGNTSCLVFHSDGHCHFGDVEAEGMD